MRGRNASGAWEQATLRASRHYRTSRERVGSGRDFCIAMVFSPQLRGRIGRAYVVLIIDVYTCCLLQRHPKCCFLHCNPASIPPQTCFISFCTCPHSATRHLAQRPASTEVFLWYAPFVVKNCVFATAPFSHHSSSVAGGGPTGSTIFSMQWRRTASTFVPIPTLM